MGLKKYFKRLINYVFRDYQPRTVYVRPEIIDKLDFKDKIVLVTGGSEGIGYEIAKKFDNSNALVIITGRNKEKLEKAVEKLNNTVYYQNDISDISSLDDLIERIYSKYGHIDIVVNNAGISLHEKNYFEVTEEGFDKQFGTNLKGGYFLTQKIINKQKENINFIFISSERGDQCDYLPYGLTKVAINSLVEGLSSQFYRNNIRVNGVAPGVTCSNMVKFDKNSDLSTNDFKSRRFFIPEEVAEIVAFLSSDVSNCVSGEIIHCNAGNHLNSWFK